MKCMRRHCIMRPAIQKKVDFEVSMKGEERLLTAKNKWLIAHEDAKIDGAFVGLKGENIALE